MLVRSDLYRQWAYLFVLANRIVIKTLYYKTHPFVADLNRLLLANPLQISFMIEVCGTAIFRLLQFGVAHENRELIWN